MDGTHAHAVTHQESSDIKANGIFGSSLLEAFGAIATVALSIVGLAGVFSTTLAATAAVVAGTAALAEGGAFGWRRAGIEAEPRLFEGAASADFQGGLATLVLGILALLGIASLTLLSVAVIVLGVTFLLSGRALTGLAAVVLGILAVAGFTPLTLVLVGFLSLGAGLLFAGSENAADATASQV